jgi:hypothetical protein
MSEYPILSLSVIGLVSLAEKRAKPNTMVGGRDLNKDTKVRGLGDN